MQKGKFHLLTSVGQGVAKDKIKPMKEAFFVSFTLSFVGPWTMEVKGFPVVVRHVTTIIF
jgi:hypothetical protein